MITRKALRKQAERFCFQDTHSHVINCASICMLGPAPYFAHANHLLWAYIFIIVVKRVSALKASFIAVMVYVMRISCVISNAILCDMHTFKLGYHLCRRRDGE